MLHFFTSQIIQGYIIIALQFFPLVKVTGAISDILRVEILKLGSKYFQYSEGQFLPTNSDMMNPSWFKRILGHDSGEEVTQTWLVYSF